MLGFRAQSIPCPILGPTLLRCHLDAGPTSQQLADSGSFCIMLTSDPLLTTSDDWNMIWEEYGSPGRHFMTWRKGRTSHQWMGAGGRETSGGTVAARRDLERLDGVFLPKGRRMMFLVVCQLLPASASRLTSER